MRSLILVVHISLDGFVAGTKGELDGFPKGEENLAFVHELTRDADTALFGRKSYELLNSYWPTARNRPGATAAEIGYSNWYNEAQKIVVSRTLPDPHLDRTIVIREDISNEIHKIKKEPGNNILIFGSPTLSHELTENNLIDSYWVFVNPVIFGEGIPLFRTSTTKMNLRLMFTKEFSNGEVALHSVVDRE